MTARLRPAAPGDGAALLDVTRAAVTGLAVGHYPPEVIAGWMIGRTPAAYEAAILAGPIVVAEKGGAIIGFVGAEPGVLTRLFLRPEAAGQGLGARLVRVGLALAAVGATGPVVLEATLNARAFYERHGFVFLRDGLYRHNADSPPIAIVHMVLAEGRMPAAAGSVAEILGGLG